MSRRPTKPVAAEAAPAPAADAELDNLLTKAGEDTVDVRPGFSSIFLAFVLAASPFYLFLTPMFDLNILEHGIHFAVVSTVATALLVYAYDRKAHRELRSVSQKRRAQAQKNNRPLDSIQASASAEAQSWSVFITNAWFLGLFLLFAFYIFPQVDAPAWLNYSVSVLGSAGIVAAVQSGLI